MGYMSEINDREEGEQGGSMIVSASSSPAPLDSVSEITSNEFAQMLSEIQEQPAWRMESDVCADYYDGNQLDADTLQAMRDLGMAPIIENLTAPTIDAVLGLEAKTRLDWKISANADEDFAEVAEAMNYRMKQAETESMADRACSDGFAAQVKAGLGWVEVAREHNPFRYPHRVEYVHRNEVYWDMRGKRPDTTDWRYLVRKRWHDVEVLQKVFPKHAETILMSCNGWSGFDPTMLIEGGRSTGLAMDFARERGWTIEEQEWRDTYRSRLCLSEVWYRRWVRVHVMTTPDGRAIEFDRKNRDHVEVVAYNMVQVRPALVTKVRLAWFVGPHMLADMPTPYKHDKFPYVPFFGKREDMTGVPYGLIRAMKPLQDEINARNTKMIWLLAAKRVTMTEGVTKDSPETVRREAARPDAMHVLSSKEMQKPGAVFKVETDFQLNAQQYSALQDKRQSLKNVAGVYASFEGNQNGNISGIAANTLVEQSTQTLAEIFDNFQFARRQVGDLLLSLIIEDIGEKETEVRIDNEINGTKSIILNARQDGSGLLTNDVQRARLKTALSDVPSTASYRSQRLMALTEITKSLPPQYQGLVLDFVMAATDLPERGEIVKRLRKMLQLGDAEPPKNEQEAATMAAEQEAARMAQEVQQRAVMLDLEEKQARIEKMRAETDRAIADLRAMSAEADARGQAGMQPTVESQISEQITATQEHFIEQIDALREQIADATRRASDAEMAASAEIEKAQIEKERDIEVAKISASASDVADQFIDGMERLRAEIAKIAAKVNEEKPRQDAKETPEHQMQPISLTVVVDASKPTKKTGTVVPNGNGGFDVVSEELPIDQKDKE